MNIINSTAGDIDEIFRLYRLATAVMKTKSTIFWPEFDRQLVETEIAEQRQFKLLIDGTIACVWAITFHDEQIWEERDNSFSIYIHRIATDPDLKGRNFVGVIVEWAKQCAKENNKKYIRLDTVGPNDGLVKKYTSCGFDYLGLFKMKNTEGLPAHYDNASVCLFEIAL